MKKLIGLLRPFDMTQTFYVYEDGNQLKTVELTIDEIPETVLQLCDKYNIEQIDLVGSKGYSKGLIKQIQEKESIKYNKNTLIIKCI